MSAATLEENGIAVEEAELLRKRRERQAATKAKVAQNRALTGINADYPSLSTLELRAGIEHDGSHGEPHAHFPLEEAGVAASCQAGNRGGKGPPLEAQPEVAEPPSGPGSRGVVGPLRGDEAEAEQSRGVAPDVRVQRPNRGLGQRLKAGAHQGPTHAAMIQATFRDSGRWRLVEVFTGDPLFMRY